MKQSTALPLRSWGGKRRGAGRKPLGARGGVAHRAREPLRPSQPIHVSIRLAGHVWNLRSERAFAIIHGVLQSVRPRPGFRVAHFSVQGNHLHLLVEANGTVALAAGMRAFSIRLARGLNRMMGVRGAVLEDRFHAHVLRTPAEVRNALRYVLGNRANHLTRLGLPAERERPDRYSSAVVTPPLGGQLELWAEGVVSPSRTWLLRTAERGPRGESSAAQSGSRG
jgi:REP element-mobilizing transposase RayT